MTKTSLKVKVHKGVQLDEKTTEHFEIWRTDRANPIARTGKTRRTNLQSLSRTRRKSYGHKHSTRFCTGKRYTTARGNVTPLHGEMLHHCTGKRYTNARGNVTPPHGETMHHRTGKRHTTARGNDGDNGEHHWDDYRRGHNIGK